MEQCTPLVHSHNSKRFTVLREPLSCPVSVWTMAPDATVLVALRRQSSF